MILNTRVKIIGGGLAGCEAAWQLAEHNISVELYEMKPEKKSPAHRLDTLAELVCSNSLKAQRLDSAAGLLKAEMERLGSLVIPCAKKVSVSAGGALAVDREEFSRLITKKILSHPNIKLISEEVTQLPDGYVIVATGPLTSDKMADSISRLCGEQLSFFDAAAPIVTAESIDMSKVFYAARYDRGGADYINCPMDKEEYLNFHKALSEAQTAPLKEFDRESFRVYEGCMPIEVLAKRGVDTLRFGTMRPVGLNDPKTGRRPYAVVQLRCENVGKTMYNLVGFQTNLKFGEQRRVFSMIPGLEKADFVRYGVMHRNSFINSPKLLLPNGELKNRFGTFFAGQITGVEGYIESAASGLVVGINVLRSLCGDEPLILPKTTMIGALTAYINDESIKDFQPMGCNMGILPPLDSEVRDKKLKYMKYAERALADLDSCLAQKNGECNENNS